MRNSKGFTLFEVLIALAILAIAMIALIASMQHATQTLTHVKRKAACYWMLDNTLAKNNYYFTPNQSGQMHLLNDNFKWRATLTRNAFSLHTLNLVGSDVDHTVRCHLRTVID